MKVESDQDDRPIYSDVGIFTRGRSGYHPEPIRKEKIDLWWAVLGGFAIAAAFALSHLAMPVMR